MDILFSSTIELADAIRRREQTAADVVDAHLAQIERHNPALNAVVISDAKRARERAIEADEALARGEVWGPLHGVPFTLKDAFATAGVRSTVGTSTFDHVPAADGAVAARLKGAGGILLGKTNVAPLLGDFQTDNEIFGRTNNPWDVSRTPGGSSGGAAAAVASGMSPFEIGTDLSGSVRIPAHFCGLFGLKPTEHRVSLVGVVPDPGGDAPRSIRIMSSIGPMARSLDDLALLHGIIAGPDGLDTDVPPVPVDDVPVLSLKRLRIAVAPTFPGVPVARQVQDAVTGLADQLEREGAIVEEPTLPTTGLSRDLMNAGQLIGMMLGAFQPASKKSTITLAQYLHALHARDQAIIAWERFFTEWDALLCPPSMTTAFPHCEPGLPLAVDAHEKEYFMVGAHATLFNYTGHPAVVLPCRMDRAGLPIGVQLVGGRWRESPLLGTAAAISGITGTFKRPPGY